MKPRADGPFSVERLRTVVLGNIAALLVASGTLVWNWAVFTTRLDLMEEQMNVVVANQQLLLTNVAGVRGELAELERLRQAVDRLEGFHFGTESALLLSSALPARAPAREEVPHPVVHNPPKETKGVDSDREDE